jgi:hypothetical protein
LIFDYWLVLGHSSILANNQQSAGDDTTAIISSEDMALPAACALATVCYREAHAHPQGDAGLQPNKLHRVSLSNTAHICRCRRLAVHLTLLSLVHGSSFARSIDDQQCTTCAANTIAVSVGKRQLKKLLGFGAVSKQNHMNSLRIIESARDQSARPPSKQTKPTP